MDEHKLEAAREMARAHAEIDPDVKQIFLLESPDEGDPEEPIKLLEVVEGAFEGGIEPVSFAPNPGRGVPYPSVIVEVSPHEFEAMDKTEVQFAGEVWRVTKDLLAQAIGA
jgi:hypothetical protein